MRGRFITNIGLFSISQNEFYDITISIKYQILIVISLILKVNHKINFVISLNRNECDITKYHLWYLLIDVVISIYGLSDITKSIL